MKKILLIALLGLTFASCEQDDARVYRSKKAAIVKDEYGVNYRIITIEGCEFYYTSEDSSFGLAKVDCNCVPDRNNR